MRNLECANVRNVDRAKQNVSHHCLLEARVARCRTQVPKSCVHSSLYPSLLPPPSIPSSSPPSLKPFLARHDSVVQESETFASLFALSIRLTESGAPVSPKFAIRHQFESSWLHCRFVILQFASVHQKSRLTAYVCGYACSNAPSCASLNSCGCWVL